MGPFSFSQGFKPISYFIKTFIAGRFGHSGIHISVLMRLARNRCFEIVRGTPYRQSRSWITCLFQIFQVSVSMASFTFCRRTENSRYIVVPFNVRLCSEIQITTVCL